MLCGGIVLGRGFGPVVRQTTDDDDDVTYQLHVSANAAVAIIRLDTIYQRNYIDVI